MSLDSFMTGVLSAMTPIITPDWGKLVVLIPMLLTLVVLAYLAVTAFKWTTMIRTSPAAPRPSAARGALAAPPSSKQIKAPARAEMAIGRQEITAATGKDAGPSGPKAAAEPAPEHDSRAADANAGTGATKKSRRFWGR